MKIAANILQILSMAECRGDEVRLVGTLDRKTYQKVNEVLEACSFKWNRKAKAHVTSDGASARDLLDAAITTGEVTTSRDVGFFPTPVALAEGLVQLAEVGPENVCLEPSAGTGRIVDALLARNPKRVFCVERDLKMRADLKARSTVITVDVGDFMDLIPVDFGPGDPIDRIVMNPPFCKVGAGDHLDHVGHAYSLLAPRGILVAVLPSSVLFRNDRRYTEFRHRFTRDYGGEIDNLPEHSFRESGTDVNTCVLKVRR